MRSLFALAGVVLGLATLELALAVLWPQEDIFLYEYRDGLVFNRPGFDNPFAMTPWASLQQLRKRLPAYFQSRGGPLAAQFFKARIKTNAAGQRDDREPGPEKTGRFRVLNLGDSIGFGWPVELGETYLKRLESRLPGIETVNCSLVAAHTAELLALYEKSCSRYAADLVVLQFVVHIGTLAPDYIDTDPYGPEYRLIKALWRTERARALEAVSWDADGTPRLSNAARADPRIEGALKAFYEPRLPLYHRLNTVRLLENRWLAGSLNESGGTFLEDKLRKGPAPAGAEARIAPTLRYLASLRSAVEKRGAKLLILFFPTSYQARQNVLGRRPEFELLKQALGSKGYAWADVGERVNARNLDEIYYENDHHPKPAGHELIAGVLADKLKALYGKERF